MFKQNGSLLIGMFKEGAMHGKGVFIYTDGSVYEGEFHKGYAESKKAVYKCEEFSYEGGFRKNTFDGQGTEKGEDYKFVGTY